MEWFEETPLERSHFNLGTRHFSQAKSEKELIEPSPQPRPHWEGCNDLNHQKNSRIAETFFQHGEIQFFLESQKELSKSIGRLTDRFLNPLSTSDLHSSFPLKALPKQGLRYNVGWHDAKDERHRQGQILYQLSIPLPWV